MRGISFAASKLVHVRDQLQYVSPCQVNPEFWDAPNPERETVREAICRIEIAREQCAQCDIWDLCEAQRKEEGRNALGIWNGVVVYDRELPSMNAKVRAGLERRKSA